MKLALENTIPAFRRRGSVITPPAVKTTSDLTFTSSTGIANNSQVFSSTGGAGYTNHTGLDVISVAAGQAARIYWQYKSSDGDFGFLGLNLTNAQSSYTGFEWGIQLNGGKIYLWQSNNSFDTGVTLNNNDWCGIYMNGGVAKIQRSSDGNTWTDLQINLGWYRPLYPVQLYIVCNVHSAGKIYYPKVDLYGPGVASKALFAIGNSIMVGWLTDNGSSISTNTISQQSWVSKNAGNDYVFNNQAGGGNSINQNITTFNNNIAPCITAGANFGTIIVMELEGVNTLTGKSGAAAFSDMQTLINTVLNQDSRIKLAVGMTPSFNPATVGNTNAQRDIFNNSLAGLIGTNPRLTIGDIRGIPELNDELAYQSATYYYQPGGVHLLQPGQDLMADVFETAISGF